jgi:uncharacterized protein YjbI with pentapeptide repeats
MANEEQLAILKQGVEVWNKWRVDNSGIVHLGGADLSEAKLWRANLSGTDLFGAKLLWADLAGADCRGGDLRRAHLNYAHLDVVNFTEADLRDAELIETSLFQTDFSKAKLKGSNFSGSGMFDAIFADTDLNGVLGLESVYHKGPSSIGIDVIARSKGKLPDKFLRGCGLSDWEIEETKLYNPDLGNEEIDKILYRIHDLRASQALQISPLFISYSHADSKFVDKVGDCLAEKGVRYWRDIHEMKAGRIETQIDRGIRQNPTVLLVISESSLSSDWVEHEVRTARALEKDMGRDVLCPVALDDSWKSSPWPKRLMEQIMEYNILDFSAWQDEGKFDEMFRRLIDGLDLFYK